MKKIKLFEHFGSRIFTRSAIFGFFKELENIEEAEAVLDFEGIDFISRSCADEYLRLKEKMFKRIVEENMCDVVCSMFKLVKIQRKNSGISYSVDSSAVKNSVISA